MLIMFDFAITQVRYIKRAMEKIASYRPDAQTPTTVGTMLTNAVPVRADFVTKDTAIGNARAVRRDTIETLHDGCVGFAAQAKSVFRKNRVVTDQLLRLPTQDNTFQQTMTRADAILALWHTLPDVPDAGGGTTTFTFMDGTDTIDLDVFGSWQDLANAADADIPVKDGDFQLSEATLHKTLADLDDFITAALEQGRSQFDAGTPNREIIDAIPTTPPQHVPGDCEITSAEPAGAGTVHLVATSEFSTGTDVFDIPPGATEPVQIKDDELGTEFDLPGLAPGVHTLTARGVNARGPGPMSAPVIVTVS